MKAGEARQDKQPCPNPKCGAQVNVNVPPMVFLDPDSMAFVLAAVFCGNCGSKIMVQRNLDTGEVRCFIFQDYMLRWRSGYDG
jgi:hypothetical protein